MTIEEIKAAFSDTIFWNYLKPYPGDSAKDPEPPLLIQEGTPDEDGNRNVWIVFHSGEIGVTVARLNPANERQDAEFHTTDQDVSFIANLPVIMPILLARIGLLERTAETLLAVTHHQRSCPAFQGGAGPCDCGIDLIRRGARAVLSDEPEEVEVG